MTLTRDKNTPILNPAWIIPLSVAAGLMVSGAISGWVLAASGRKKAGLAVGAAGFVLGFLLLGGMLLWNVEWHWVGLTLSLLHLLLGGGLFFVVCAMLPRPQESQPQSLAAPPSGENGTFRHVIAGAIGGGMVAGILGTVAVVFYLLAVDRFLSTWLPVAFADEYALGRVAFSGFCLALAGALAGGIGGRFRPRTSPGQFLVWSGLLIFIYLTWTIAAELTIALPGFQAGAATGKGWEDILAAILIGGLGFGIVWSVFLLFLVTAPGTPTAKAWRNLAVPGLNLLAAVTLAVTMGYAAETCLALGRHFERTADINKALWCYENGLKKMPRDTIASFLQYRAALIYHKLGDRERAGQGFARLVAKYNSDPVLEKKAGRFLDNLRRSPEKKRVVLPGVETRTEYKSAYCVPNSLALTMRYWGADVDAKEIGRMITALSGGTFSVNQAWFALQKGFHHDFLPMAGLDDIKRCIDAGFPVMVYVPSHVLVIFGYDEALETFVTYDTSTSDLWSEYIQKDFVKAWKKQAATVILAYPPEKEKDLPPDIAQRLLAFSDNYLHFQLYGLDAPSSGVSAPHLMAAAGETGEFFFPVTAMYAGFPGLRKELALKFDPETVVPSIIRYFSEDFDEGRHLYGEYNDEDSVMKDEALEDSIQYLIGNKRFDVVESLITRIDQEGAISGRMLGDIGMIDIASGDLGRGMDRIQRAMDRADAQNWSLYMGLARSRSDNPRQAVRFWAKAVEQAVYYCGNTGRRSARLVDGALGPRLGLDQYGYPVLAMANGILTRTKDYGESREALVNAWEPWVHCMPFDAPVASALGRIYQEDLAGMNPAKDAADVHSLSAKLDLAGKRAARYNIHAFAPH